MHVKLKYSSEIKLLRNIKINKYTLHLTCGIGSLIGSLITFSGELKLEGPTLCLITRGEPDVLLGDRGGALPAGNIEGSELLAEAWGLEEFPGTFKGTPAFASFNNDVT